MNKPIYYIYTDNEPEGPYTLDELKAREVTKYTPIWCDGMTDWLPAGRLEALAPLWSHRDADSPFVHHPDAPPPFDQQVYEKTLTDDVPATAPLHRSTLFWMALVGLLVIAAGWWGYNRSTLLASEHALAALREEERRWDDSVNSRARDEQSATVLPTGTGVDNNEELRRDREENARNYARMNIERLVRCTKSFERKRFGGIQNATVTLYNGSDYPIDRAVFRVRYVKANGDVFEEEAVVIEQLSPHTSKTIEAPTSKRGQQMQAELVKLVSNELGLVKNVDVKF